MKVKNPYKQAGTTGIAGQPAAQSNEPVVPLVKVTSIKEAIKNVTQLDIDRQRLIFQGKLMRDQDNLADFKVRIFKDWTHQATCSLINLVILNHLTIF